MGTTELHKLLRQQQTVTILSNVVISSSGLHLRKSMGWHRLRIEYFFRTFLITLSTCIRTLAILLVCFTSIPLSCFCPFVKAGIFIVAQYGPTLSFITNPRSTNTVSPGERFLKSPLLSVRCLSLTLTLHPLDMKLTLPCGVIPIKYFTVL